ncbi:Hint domain-containing protein [Thalassorhabdomicrobium marinisediminis]|uniref:Hemolysin n=1 Tax=Thalassorhabdomicrobium marinisediminis TaxID=2170577 RepID=A0A2T7FZ40_9RHOB|nr:Hint domain-containing protein [Thalassorhabdomicrobium marinisediminis]PVA07436.1 hemolysin [Thalassorhabdomicrobium marinisediminis]
MPYITEIPASFLTIDPDLGVIDLTGTGVLNDLENSQYFERYDIESPTGDTVTRGDDIAAVDENGDPLVSGTYAGSGTLSTAATTLKLPLGLAKLKIQVDPVDGHFVQGDDGKGYFISDEPFDGNNLGVTISGKILGVPLDINVPISELGNLPILGPVLDPLSAAVNNILNTVVVNVDYDPDGELDLDDDEVFPCFVAGTMILTPDGERPVDDLDRGDLVFTRDNGPQPIRWIGSRGLSAETLTAKPNLRPIRIMAGALGEGAPAVDLMVSPQHRVLVRSKIAQRMFGAQEVLVAAKHLLCVDGVEVADDLPSVEYFHFLFERHEVIYSNGAETESLFTGPQALLTIGAAARQEIFELFPELLGIDHRPEPARTLVPGRRGRKLADRHAQNRKALVTQAGAPSVEGDAGAGAYC